MSTLVPIEAKGGMILHPGPGPFAAGPGPFPARKSLPSPWSCPSLSAANAAAEENIITAAVVAMTTAFAHFDSRLMLFLSYIDACSLQVLHEVPTDESAVNPEDSECKQQLQGELGWFGETRISTGRVYRPI